MNIKERIKKLSSDYQKEITGVRRKIHMNPELSFKEYNTSAYIEELLNNYGITKKKKLSGTGIVALIEGKNASAKSFALRADMDALPIQEAGEAAYKSKNAGVMHACGHDVHTASLLGAAKILNELKNEFEGTVKLIFQPGEEKLPGGASLMIKEGALKNPEPAGIIAQHVMPVIETGKVGFRKGIYMASTDEIYVHVRGKGGHGAMPHLNIDPVLIASHMIVALQQVISRNANPAIPSVLSFGKVIANGATNVIPDEVYLEGTFRTLDEPWRKEAHIKIKTMAESIVTGMGGSCEMNIVSGYPALVNEPELTESVRAAAEIYLGKENVIDLDIWMAAEDFAFYSQHVAACFYRLGTGNKAKGIVSSVHTATFDIDESALETGMGLMAFLAINELSKQ